MQTESAEGHARNMAGEKSRQAGLAENSRDGVREFVEGLRNWRIWHLIGSAELRRRYARSWLGQWWMVVSTGASIAIIGWVWSALWGLPLAEMIVYIGVSQIIWLFLTGVLTDCSLSFQSNAHFFANQYIAPSTMVMAAIYRNLLLLAHNAAIVVLLMLVFGGWPGAGFLLLIPALLLVIIFSYWSGYLIGALSARFRDVGQIIALVIQLGYFVTPIIWKVEQAPPALRSFLDWSLLHILVDILRTPVLGTTSSNWTWLVMLVLALGGFALSLPLIGRIRGRIAFWV